MIEYEVMITVTNIHVYDIILYGKVLKSEGTGNIYNIWKSYTLKVLAES